MAVYKRHLTTPKELGVIVPPSYTRPRVFGTEDIHL
jgi:hypothetical protein